MRELNGLSRCLHNFSAFCGVSLILLATMPQPAMAQADPCAPYANNAPYYQRCQQIHQQSARIREEQERQAKHAAEVREERLGRFYDPENKPPSPTRSKKMHVPPPMKRLPRPLPRRQQQQQHPQYR